MDTTEKCPTKPLRRLWPYLLGYVLLLSTCVCACAGSQPHLVAYRPLHVSRGTEEGVFVLTSGENVTLLLFGSGLSNKTELWLSDQHSCSDPGVTITSLGLLELHTPDNTRAEITFQHSVSEKTKLYFCLSTIVSEDKMIQGSEDDPVLQLLIELASSKKQLIPLPVEIVLIIILICMSGLFSGLNLGLMSLDPTTLKLVMESGSKRQKIYAKLIYRVRKYGNYLLCTLLLGNVLVNSTLAILLESVLGSGVYAVVASTIVIVIFGEIIPQAICSRYGLMIGAYTIWLTYFFMVVTFPLSFPISIILHFILGKEIGAVYTREHFLGLLKVTEDHHNIGKDEVQIISGALCFKEKTAEDVMTKFDDVYCLDITSVLDFKMMRDIYDSGFSRIPVYEEMKANIVGVLYAKDLAFVDPDDETPLRQVLNFYNRELTMVYNDSRLDELLEEFIRGKCHMAVVNRVCQEGLGDPLLNVVGVVTLEDIVEEILQLEIVDETDRIMDNRSLKPNKRKHVDVGEFAEESVRDRPHLSSQQKLAVYQFLSTNISAFKSDKLSPSVLKQLLNRDGIVWRISLESAGSQGRTLYRANTPAASFTLLIEGHVQVEVGKEGLQFEAGSFHYFGEQSLNSISGEEYISDFTVRPLSDCLLLVIGRNEYRDACKATLFQQTKDSTSDLSTRLNGGNVCSPLLHQLQTSPPLVTSTHPRPAKRRQLKFKSKSVASHEMQCLLLDVDTQSLEEEGGEEEGAVAALGGPHDDEHHHFIESTIAGSGGSREGAMEAQARTTDLTVDTTSSHHPSVWSSQL